jgi:hypothetical protein
MMRKHRGAKVEGVGAGAVCAVCAMSDARALVSVILSGGQRVTLCGTHAVMHRRCRATLRTIADLQASLGDRRETDRRGDRGEVDELAERLQSAFTRERRRGERRAS